MDTVKESKLKLQFILNNSESIQLNKCIETFTLLIPTSIKANIESNIVINIASKANKCEPFIPINRPNNPETSELSMGKIIIDKYIIYIIW